MRAKFIYEKFIQDSDPIKDMKIGIDPEKVIKEFEKVLYKLGNFSMFYDIFNIKNSSYYLINFYDEQLSDYLSLNFVDSIETAKYVIDDYGFTNIEPQIGWILVSDAAESKSPMILNPYDFKSIMKEIYIIKEGGPQELDEKIKKSQKQINRYKQIKKYLAS